MKASIKILSSLLLALTLNACSNGSGSNSPKASPSKPDVIVNNDPTPEFDYSQVMYEPTGTCGNNNLNDRFVSIKAVKIGTAADGKDVYAETDLLIYPTGVFKAQYQEEDMVSYTETKYSYKRYRTRVLAGFWTLKDGKMLLGNLGTLQAHLEDNKIIAEFSYQQNIVSSGLAGKVANASRVSSSSAIRYGREVCPASEDLPGQFAGVMNQSHALKPGLKSLQALNTDVELSTRSILVTKMELFLETDGRYFLLVKVFDQSVSLGIEKTYIVDDFVWERVIDTLDLYSGKLTSGNSGEFVLNFNQDLRLVENGQIVGSLPTNGKSIRMYLKKSDYTMDDLTSVYADGGIPIYSN